MQRSAPVPVTNLGLGVPGLLPRFISQHQRERVESRIQLGNSREAGVYNRNRRQLPRVDERLQIGNRGVVQLRSHRRG